MTEVILKATKNAVKYYTLQYKIKDFVPQIIPPKNIFQKIVRMIFGNKYTSNNWKTIYCFSKYDCDYKQYIDICGHSNPYKYWEKLLVGLDEFDKYKEKFKSLEDIQNFEKSERERLSKAYTAHIEYMKQFKDEIVL